MRTRTPSAGFDRQDKGPGRALQRPTEAEWAPDEPMTLAEAASVFWPTGPLTTTSLRTAVRDGQLATATIAGKLFTCPRAIREMMVFRKRVAPPRNRVPERAGLLSTLAYEATPPVSQDRLLEEHARLKATIELIDANSHDGSKNCGGRQSRRPRIR